MAENKYPKFDERWHEFYTHRAGPLGVTVDYYVKRTFRWAYIHGVEDGKAAILHKLKGLQVTIGALREEWTYANMPRSPSEPDVYTPRVMAYSECLDAIDKALASCEGDEQDGGR